MKRLWLDFETFYSDEYSLQGKNGLTPVEYIVDQRYESLGSAFIHEDGWRCWVDGPELPAFFRTIDWADTFAISHNALFDMLILAVRYGIRPKKYGCTLSMARNHLAHILTRFGLDFVCRHYGIGGKLDTIKRMKGVGFAAMVADPQLHQEEKTYGLDDCGKCQWIFERMMAEGFPTGELDVVDWVVRMACEPRFEVDRTVVAEHLNEVLAHKRQLLENAKLDSRDNLMSDDKLAGILTMLGVDPVPMKLSKTTGQEVWAFAKSDKHFTDLQEHPDPDVQAVVAARLGHKSTIEETRTARFLKISNVCVGMPVPLRYSGAHTHRFSGDWSLNLQNLPVRQGRAKLRKALRAPKGSVVVAVDASQIEARINAVISGQWDLVEDFRNGIDVYAKFAEEQVYHYPVTKNRQPTERFVGKTAILSLGYSSSAPVFQSMCRLQGNVTLTILEAMGIVGAYRKRYQQIVENWRTYDRMILPLLEAHGTNHTFGPLHIQTQRIILPNGNTLKYRDLRRAQYGGQFQWIYVRGTTPGRAGEPGKDIVHKVYGAKLVENVVQALAFVHIVEVAMRVAAMTERELLPAHQVHDELVYVVPEHLAELTRDIVVDEMAKPPSWLPSAPFAAEGHIGANYGDVK